MNSIITALLFNCINLHYNSNLQLEIKYGIIIYITLKIVQITSCKINIIYSEKSAQYLTARALLRVGVDPSVKDANGDDLNTMLEKDTSYQFNKGIRKIFKG